MIAAKKGHCIDCAPDDPEKYLTAGRCKFHYWKHRNAVNTERKKGTQEYKDKQAQKKALDLWFANQVKQLPACCENCGERLFIFAPWAAKAFIAHILPKRHFKSVMIHPMNRAFLYIDCHTNFDTWDEKKIITMPVFPIILQRTMQFLNEVHENEFEHFPSWITHVHNYESANN